MKQNTKDWIQYLSAIAMLISAIGLALWSFQTLNMVHSTVLGYVGEAIAFAAAVYGLALYAKNEIHKEVNYPQMKSWACQWADALAFGRLTAPCPSRI